MSNGDGCLFTCNRNLIQSIIIRGEVFANILAFGFLLEAVQNARNASWSFPELPPDNRAKQDSVTGATALGIAPACTRPQ